MLLERRISIVTWMENINEGFKGEIKGLTRGPHVIKIVAANHKHEGLVAEAAVTIEVE